MALRPASAKAKGSAGEREVARMIGGKRQVLSGAIDGTNDVVSPEVLSSFAIEVKRRAKLPNILTEALAQAAYSVRGSGKKPMVFYRQDHGPWMVACYGEDFMEFVNALAEVGNGYKLKGLIRSVKRILDEAEGLC